MVTMFKRTDDHEMRLRVVEVGNSSNTQSVTAWQKFGWIVAAAMLAFGFNLGKDTLSRQALAPAGQSQDYVGKLPKTTGR